MNGSNRGGRSQWRPGVERVAASRAEMRKAYALGEFSGLPERLELPTKGPRPQNPLHAAAQAPVILPARLSAALEALAYRLVLPIIVPLLAGWAVVLSRWSGQDDILIGARLASRSPADGKLPQAGIRTTVGVRCRLREELTVKRFLKELKSGLRRADSHQDAGFQQMAEALRLSGEAAPDLQFTIALDAMPEDRQPSGDGAQTSLELALSLAESAQGFIGTLDYASELFEREMIERMLAGWELALEAMTEDLYQPVSDLPVMSATEWNRVVHEPNATAVEYPRKQLIHELFEEQARRTPDAIALEAGVEHGERPFTFAQLNASANRLACHLRSMGIGPDCPVGLHVRRGTGMIVGMLGILKAGGAYVPLDPEYPVARLAFILADAAPQVVITQESLRGTLPRSTAQTVSLDGDSTRLAACPTEDLSASRFGLSPSNLAYIIYTSGSTGRPKGVAVEHRNVVNLIHWARGAGGPGDFRSVLQSTSLNFDLSVYECFVPLCSGGCNWREHLLEREYTPFPRDLDLPLESAPAWDMAAIEIPGDLRIDLQKWSRQNRTTLVLCVLTAYIGLLSRWCNMSRTVVQCLSDGRQSIELRETIGYFATPLFICIETPDTITLPELLRLVVMEYCEAVDHADCSYLETLVPRPAFCRACIFNWVPQGRNYDRDLRLQSSSDMVCEPMAFGQPMLKRLGRDNDPGMTLFDTGQAITGGLYFPVCRFFYGTMDRFAKAFLTLLEEMPKHSNLSIGSIAV